MSLSGNVTIANAIAIALSVLIFPFALLILLLQLVLHSHSLFHSIYNQKAKKTASKASTQQIHIPRRANGA